MLAIVKKKFPLFHIFTHNRQHNLIAKMVKKTDSRALCSTTY